MRPRSPGSQHRRATHLHDLAPLRQRAMHPSGLKARHRHEMHTRDPAPVRRCATHPRGPDRLTLNSARVATPAPASRSSSLHSRLRSLSSAYRHATRHRPCSTARRKKKPPARPTRSSPTSARTISQGSPNKTAGSHTPRTGSESRKRESTCLKCKASSIGSRLQTTEFSSPSCEPATAAPPKAACSQTLV